MTSFGPNAEKWGLFHQNFLLLSSQEARPARCEFQGSGADFIGGTPFVSNYLKRLGSALDQ
jgi:hypothetical protein